MDSLKTLQKNLRNIKIFQFLMYYCRKISIKNESEKESSHQLRKP